MVERVDTFKNRLQKALEEREVKPAELARRTGIREGTISQYRSGYAEPKREKLLSIASALMVDPAWLMGLDVPMVKVPRTISEIDTDYMVEIMSDDDLNKHIQLLIETKSNRNILYDLIEMYYEKEKKAEQPKKD